MVQLIEALRRAPTPENKARLHSGGGEIDADILNEIKQRLQASEDKRAIELEYY